MSVQQALMMSSYFFNLFFWKRKKPQKTQNKDQNPMNSNPAKNVLWFFSSPVGLFPSKILSQLATPTSALPGRWEEHDAPTSCVITEKISS